MSKPKAGFFVYLKNDILRGVKVAVHLAMWISSEFAVFVVNIADRFLTGQLTTEESKQAASEVAQWFRPEHAKLVEWHKQRQDGREAAKASCQAIREATGNKATGLDYARLHDATNWAAAGKKTKVLRKELGIKGTPRDHMAAPQLSIVAYVEALGASKVGEKRRLQQEDIPAQTAVEVVGKLAYKAHNFTKDTGGHELPLLAQKPPTMEQVAKALGAPKPSKRQQLVLEKAEMKTAEALPAPTNPQKRQGILKYFNAVPRAVPSSELDLYESH